uniref:Phosphoprotein n=1 Tax=Parastrongyloides trichosuri TaxID=131310 RepID=A0A0N4ZRI7_PARTI
MTKNNKAEDDSRSPTDSKYIQDVEEHFSDTEGWIPGDFEVQMNIESRQRQIATSDSDTFNEDSELAMDNCSSESSWPDTDDESDVKGIEEGLKGYKSVPLMIEEKEHDNSFGEKDIKLSTIDQQNVNKNNSTVYSKNLKDIHLTSRDFDYTPVEKRELVLDEEKIAKIKNAMKNINIKVPPWADKLDDKEFSDILNKIIK